MTSLLSIPRVQVCILDELFPEWRDMLEDRAEWIHRWGSIAGISRSQAWRWHSIALDAAQDLSEAA